MDWIKVEDRLPDIGRTGESEYVLAYRGARCLPEIVMYSDGSFAKKGWYKTDFSRIPFYSGKGKSRHLTFTHWCKIVLPE